MVKVVKYLSFTIHKYGILPGPWVEVVGAGVVTLELATGLVASNVEKQKMGLVVTYSLKYCLGVLKIQQNIILKHLKDLFNIDRLVKIRVEK